MKDTFLKLVADLTDEQATEFYVGCGPDKREQENYSGISFLEMNVDLLTNWLWRFDVSEGGTIEGVMAKFEGMPADDRREVLEASPFCFGWGGPTNEEEELYWKQQGGTDSRKFAFFEIDNRGALQTYLVRGDTEEECCQKLHAKLRADAPEIWSEKWEDLQLDVHRGGQTMYGPEPIVRLD
jgi:hypothetical protein